MDYYLSSFLDGQISIPPTPFIDTKRLMGDIFIIHISD